jgi:DNA-binding transcriptional LysR family regulator
MTRDIDIALLRAFVSVAETSGMTSAGRLLHLTQAAVSQQIKRLETQLDTELFDRRQKKLRLTPDGERLLAPAKRMLSLNDEVWSMMTAPQFDGEVNLGVPHDIVAPFMQPILRSFSQAWPQVRVNLIDDTTPRLLELLANGDVDLTLTTEDKPLPGDGMLLADPLVWVGATDGDAHLRQPLPIALGDKTCAFRASALAALRAIDCKWRSVCETSNMGPLQTSLEADLAIAPLLSQTVPSGLRVVADAARLPALPTFYINLHLPPTGAMPIAAELADHIRRHFAARFPLAA